MNVRRHHLRQRLLQQKVATKPKPVLRMIPKPNIRKLKEKTKQQQAKKQALVQELRNRRVLKKEEETPPPKKIVEEKREVIPKPVVVKKNIVKDEPAVTTQRPTRKTKEAAAIYMEILGHKLIGEGKHDDDNVSIDSFPELPNVRKMEQRENELKAKAKVCDKKGKIESVKAVVKKTPEKKASPVVEQKIMTRNKAQLLQNEANKNEIKVSPNSEAKATKARNRRIELEAIKASMIKAYDTSSDSEESFTEDKLKEETREIEEKDDKAKTVVVAMKPENTFNDSDEEPLAKLTTLAKSSSSIKSNVSTVKKDDIQASTSKKDEIKPIMEKTKRECTKKLQSYLFSSSDDDEKCFHGFVEATPKVKAVKSEQLPVVASADLLRRDVGRRFGKGKVNMSNEQIEKWLKDSEMAGGGCDKVDEVEEMLGCGERIPTETTFDLNLLCNINTEGLKSSLLVDKKVDVKIESPVKVTSPLKQTPEKPIPLSKPHSIDRKLIFRKEKQAVPNANAFSASNECSVYAFGEENEDAISTPFRRPIRRPSSTATSKSEDDSCKQDDSNKSSGRFRIPVKPLANKQEVSLVVSTDESTSIALQLNLESAEESGTQTETSDGELFYIPLQPAKQTIAVKVGAELTSSPSNQKVVMRAKILTQEGQMCPPVHTLQKHKSSEKLNVKICKTPEAEEQRYKVPSSPSASSSSSAKICSRRQSAKPKTRSYEILTPITLNEFPGIEGPAQIVEAPTFHPNDKEFQDPIEYIEKIRQTAEQFGICRIVPPSSFKPECKVSDDMRFTAYNQYVHKMLHRWGPNFKELMAIRKYLGTQNITLTHPPWVRFTFSNESCRVLLIGGFYIFPEATR